MSDQEIKGALEAARAQRPVLLGESDTLAGAAIKMIFEDADASVAGDVRSGLLHKRHALATLYHFREAVRPFNERLADELIAEQTEKAEVRG